MWQVRMDMTRDECRKCLRCLELDAYGNMVSVLRAQGPLTDDKRKLLAELAKVLHISNERHRAEVRRAVNDDKLTIIADQLNGSNTWTDWAIEGRRTIPLLPRSKGHTAFTGLANSLSLVIAAANEKRIPYDEKNVSYEVKSSEVKVETDVARKPTPLMAKSSGRKRKKTLPEQPTDIRNAKLATTDMNYYNNDNNEVNCRRVTCSLPVELIENKASILRRAPTTCTVSSRQSSRQPVAVYTKKMIKTTRKTRQLNSNELNHLKFFKKQIRTTTNDEFDDIKSLDSGEMHYQERLSSEENSQQAFEEENFEKNRENRRIVEEVEIYNEKSGKSITPVQIEEVQMSNSIESQELDLERGEMDEKGITNFDMRCDSQRSVEKLQKVEEEEEIIEEELMVIEETEVIPSEDDYSNSPIVSENMREEKSGNSKESRSNSADFETVSSSSSICSGPGPPDSRNSEKSMEIDGKSAKIKVLEEKSAEIETISEETSKNNMYRKKLENSENFEEKSIETGNICSISREIEDSSKKLKTFDTSQENYGRCVSPNRQMEKMRVFPGKVEKIGICLKKSPKTGDFLIKSLKNETFDRHSYQIEDLAEKHRRTQDFPGRSEKIGICLKKSAITGNFSIKPKKSEDFKTTYEKRPRKSDDFPRKMEKIGICLKRSPETGYFARKLMGTENFPKNPAKNSTSLQNLEILKNSDGKLSENVHSPRETKNADNKDENSGENLINIKKIYENSTDNGSEKLINFPGKSENSSEKPKDPRNIKLKLLNHTRSINTNSTPTVNLATLRKSLPQANVIVVKKGVKLSQLSRQNLPKVVLDEKNLRISGKKVVIVPHRSLQKQNEEKSMERIENLNIPENSNNIEKSVEQIENLDNPENSNNIDNSEGDMIEERLESSFEDENEETNIIDENPCENGRTLVFNEVGEEIQESDVMNFEVVNEDIMQDVDVHVMNEEVLMEEIEQSDEAIVEDNCTEDFIEEEETIEISQEPICSEILIEQDADSVIIDAQAQIYNFEPTEENFCGIRIAESQLPTSTEEEIYDNSEDIVLENYAYKEEEGEGEEEALVLNEEDEENQLES